MNVRTCRVLLENELQPSLGFRFKDLDDPSQVPDEPKQAHQVMGLSGRPQQRLVKEKMAVCILVPWSPDKQTAKENSVLDIPVKICLLQAMTVPARHSRFVRAMIGERFFLQVAAITFQPKDRLQQLTGLLVEEPVIPAGQEVTLMIINPGMCPIHLQEGR